MTSRTLALALFTAATLAGTAHADTGLTRAQVKAELVQAQRSGDLIDYETGLTLKQLFPGAYPTRRVASEQAVAVENLPPTAAGSSAVRTGAQAVGVGQHLFGSNNVPWDYQAISQQNAEALARGQGAR